MSTPKSKPVLSTLSPQQIAGTPIYGVVTKLDFTRARKFFLGTYPATLPPIALWGTEEGYQIKEIIEGNEF